MSQTIDKAAVRSLLDKMPEDATWEDLMREIYVRQVLAAGLADSESGQVLSVREIREKYGLPG